MDSVAGLFLSTINADDDKMHKIQYYQVPHPAQKIILESDTNTKDESDTNTKDESDTNTKDESDTNTKDESDTNTKDDIKSNIIQASG